MGETERGLALLCDVRGMILHVLRNDLNLAHAVPGRLFLRLADGASRIKAMDFLVGIKEAGAILNWEWNVALENGPATLHFSGGQVGEQLLIVGATNDKLAVAVEPGGSRPGSAGDPVLIVQSDDFNRSRITVVGSESL